MKFRAIWILFSIICTASHCAHAAEPSSESPASAASTCSALALVPESKIENRKSKIVPLGSTIVLRPRQFLRLSAFRGPAPHKFNDRQNKFLILAGAGLRAADVYTTRQILRRGGEEYLLPRALVRSAPRLGIYSAGMVVATGGLMYWAHRSGHHRLERALGWTQVVFMAGLITNNTIWLHNHWSIPPIYDRR
jgi:hypothetical protein